MNIRESLKDTDLFSALSPKNLEILAQICIPKRAKKRETIFLEGNEGSRFFVLLKGRVQIYRLNPEGREVVIKVINPGEIFAEVVLFEREEYPVCAAALSDCDLLSIPGLQFKCLLENEAFRDEFIAILMGKQRYLTERIMYLTSRDVESRFFGFLDEQYGRRKEYQIDISKKDISLSIGATPETLSRLIQRLSASGLITWEGKRLRVDDSCWEIIDYS